ncbi:hypothetical protein LSH36_340g01035 [Paralvinella palmiformis]|uniref:protein-tyrosine-phosphatase n=1 Tax=Paralvinella palmiformis TaxID=53620 RepID=A0AAD9JFK4_9ANNE|nr:hypothetical protein LSH36_340g01035 [Paralvinella palmiformis]
MRGTSLAVDTMNNEFKADDRFYLRRMKEILDAFPNKGPPYCPVQLCPHVYIGSQRNADDLEGLRSLGITHVLNCAGTRRFDLSRSPYPISSGVKGYLMIPAEDHDQYDIMQHFPDAIAFLDKCKSMGGKALVHCNLGINRSGAVCAAYLMVYEQKSLLEVVGYLKDKRQYILCNKNFRRQLVRFSRCKGLLDAVNERGGDASKNSHNSDFGIGTNRLSETKRGNGDLYYSTQSLDRNGRLRYDHGKITEQRASPGEDRYNSYTLPSHPTTTSSYLVAQNYKNNRSRYDSYSANGSKSYQLESVPERKPISDFLPTVSKYDSRLRKNDSSSSLPTTIISSHKSVTFRRPTVSDVSDDSSRIRSSSGSPSPKLGFLSRIGTKIARQRSLTNISRSSLDDDDSSTSHPKRGSLRKVERSTSESDDSSLSTTRPLRVYKRSSTDTELYRKPSSLQMYRRADTIASASPELERTPSHLGEDNLLPQEFLYHKRNLAQLRSSKLAGKTSESSASGSSINLLARLKPVSKVKSNNRTNTGI